jgi:hypothetical protein
MIKSRPMQIMGFMGHLIKKWDLWGTFTENGIYGKYGTNGRPGSTKRNERYSSVFVDV